MSIVPRWFSHLPRQRQKSSSFFDLGKFFENFEEELSPALSHPGGLSISADDHNIYIEAQVPGLTAKDIDVSLDNEGVLWIKGEKKVEEDDKKKKYYRRSLSTFSYCIPLWEEVDRSVEPKAECKNGVMKITFAKEKEKQVEAKKIKVND